MPGKNKREREFKARSDTCDTSCWRGLVIGFNFIFVVGGACAIAVGVWTIIHKMNYVALLGSAYYNLIVYLLLGAGILVLLTGFLGCIGAVQKNRTVLFIFFAFLAIIFAAEIVAGILAFVYHESIHDELVKDLRANLNRNYNQTGQEALTNAVDEMQKKFKCCGVESYTDWRNSTFIKQSEKNEGLKTPISCCKTPSPGCSKRDHPSNIYRVLGNRQMGCLIELEEFIRDHLFVLAITGVAVACLEVLVIIFACCLQHSIKRDEESDSY